MSIRLAIRELDPPQLQFGGAGSHTDPKVGLANAGPYDLRFGAARQSQVNVGIVGPRALVDSAREWLYRCSAEISAGGATLLRKPFPGFLPVFHATLNVADNWCIALDGEQHNDLQRALSEDRPFTRFQKIVDLYSVAHARLAARETNRPHVVLMCIPDEVLSNTKTVERELSNQERTRAKEIERSRISRQPDLFDALREVEETEDDFLKRDLRHALKARALAQKLPIQIVTSRLLLDTSANEDAATRAWNFSVALYYKAGGVPWRLPSNRPETCFVGISFHHLRTTKQHLVQSSLAQAFSSEGEGFAIRGEGIPIDANQGRDVHLSENQAFNLGNSILHEYQLRTGSLPVRVVIHKTSFFDERERDGFNAALRDIALVEMVTLVPSAFRLLRFGPYPPKVGTLCAVNDSQNYLFTSGFMPELGTYPGPHVPQPFEVRAIGSVDPIETARDVLDLTRMNWNTADIRGKWPVTLSFSRRVGGILDEYGDESEPASSFRYFV